MEQSRFTQRKKDSKERYSTSEKAPMQCDNSTTIQLCLFNLVSRPEWKTSNQIANKAGQMH